MYFISIYLLYRFLQYLLLLIQFIAVYPYLTPFIHFPFQTAQAVLV